MKHSFRKQKTKYSSRRPSALRQDHDSNRTFTRRAFLVGGIQASLLGVLGGRLAWLQISQGQKYRVLSDQNRINVKIKAPERGQIVDRFGVPVATNERDYRLVMVPEQAGDLMKSLETLREYIAINDETIEKTIKRAKRTSAYMPVEITNNLRWEDVARVEVNITDLPGVAVETGEKRVYPYGKALAHLVGYTASVNEKDIEKDDNPVLKLPGFKIGKTGIERKFDLLMRGEAGNAQVEVNVLGREVRELDAQASKNGQRVELTLDSKLQTFVYNRLSTEKSASAVIMDVHTGAVYALASYPTYDPNIMSNGIPQTLWDELMAVPGSPMTNKAVSGQYPPASTFKMITALAGLEAGLTNSRRRIRCKGYYEFKTDRFHCWKGWGHGNLNLEQALAQSCDVYFYELAVEVGIEKIAAMARKFGLGELSGIELIEDRSGLMPDKKWKQGKYGKFWTPGNTINASIGQGYTLTTPLQLAVMTARMVNGGYAVRPHVIMQNDIKFPALGVNPKHIAQIQQGMNAVVNSEKGTAKKSRIIEDGMQMAGKTGTAQVQRITMAQRRAGIKNEDLEWKRRHHALFCGYAPVHNPRYACSVVVEHGVGGSKAAAPIARDLLYEVQKRGAGYARKNILSSTAKKA